jgi:response regulator RpfG family c-di-GMP phosphodiesterase
MDKPHPKDEPMVFAPGPPGGDNGSVAPWKVLVVDDDEEIHRVTRLALGSFSVLGRPLHLISAYTGRDAVDIMRREQDVALILLDVVMETEHAGLDAVQAIRHDLGNRFVRIVLRTGQPGQAPEMEVVRKFDINDYKEKTELTTTKLYTVLQTGLALYRELMAMERNRLGLESVIEASATLLNAHSLGQFQRGVLEQLAALLYARRDAFIVGASGVAASLTDGKLRVSAGTGAYQGTEGTLAEDVLPADALGHVRKAMDSGAFDIGPHHFAAYFATRHGSRYVVYLQSEARFSPADTRLIELFSRNVAVAFDNLSLTQDLLDSQRRLILLLSAGIEERSPDLHNHVKRVSEYSRLLAGLVGLGPDDIEAVRVAAAMHDLGKISIPDAILNKPGALTAEERRQMETHVQRGHRMLEGQRGELMQTADAVVSGHHERWDGSGYPAGLRGAQTHLYARITGLCDVFDALSSRRVYKDVWPVEQVVEYIRAQRGVQFDPQLVDVFLANLPRFLEIRERFPSDGPAPAPQRARG